LKLAKIKLPADLALILDDIKVCGRSELQKLLTLRHKYQAHNRRSEKPQEEKVAVDIDPEEQIEKELDEAMARLAKEKKR
jgi:Domain of unknown function (DUF3381)